MTEFDERPKATQELTKILMANRAILRQLDNEMTARMDMPLAQEPVSKRMYDTFLADHDKLVANLRQIKDKKALIDQLVPYGPIFNIIASLDGADYPKYYDPKLALEMQQNQFDFFRDRAIELLDAIMQTPVADAIWAAAEKENRERSRKRR